MIICVDFDGTVVEHEYPRIGREVPGAFDWMKKWQDAGARLILWTMRCDSESSGDVLTRAIDFCAANGVTFWGVNCNPEQSWSNSPKAYAHIYVDDAAFGCPLVDKCEDGFRPYVDWEKVGPDVLAMVVNRESK